LYHKLRKLVEVFEVMRKILAVASFGILTNFKFVFPNSQGSAAT